MEDTKQRSMLSFISHGNLPGANNPCRPWSSVPHASKKRQRQLCLDLGQKAFGPTPCPSCGMVYNKGEPEDEKQHRVFHQRCSNSLKFPGWAHERIILYESLQGRFLKVVDTDPVTHVKKATEVGTFVEQSLGLAEGWLLPTFGRSSPSQEVVFMYISPQHRVIGMLVLEYIARSSTLATIEPNYTSQAILPAESDVGRNPPSTCLRGSGVLEPCGQPSWFGCSDIVSICQADMETGCMKALQADAQKTHHSSSASLSDTKDSASASPICGVRAMWVSMESRRTKLASRMLTIARQHMIHGYTVPRQRLAFAQVNDAGRAFAEAYMAGILSLHFYQ
mmetsp:Transcript_4571/g.13203  ORF Transcript_4571/g.13203 Transcript_4571/m.13203 type:complete len:336 (+) Transcript_4571:3561-4568(+)